MDWKVEKIGVVGPGIVGMPMAAMLAHARIRIGQDEPAEVVVIQRNSKNSGWKVGAINGGTSVIGGIEPQLNGIVSEAVGDGLLSASHDFDDISDADLILVAVQTDKDGLKPDYVPMMGALESLCQSLKKKAKHKQPVIVFESTLAPSSMTTVIREKFASHGLIEGKDIFLGNSPNRVMPGRLVERVRDSHKLVAGLHPDTPGKISRVYRSIVTRGDLMETNSMSAEIAKTLENAYRDVRIAYSAEIARYCDEHDIHFYALREAVNELLSQSDHASNDPNEVPSGGLLIPTLGVGGHCLPKDGILLWWRAIEHGLDHSSSIIMKSREINDESPSWVLSRMEEAFGTLEGKRVSILGTAYRFNSEDTRNSPSLVAAKLLQEKGCKVVLHDPYVKKDDQNLLKFGLADCFTNDLQEALRDADYILMAVSHLKYVEGLTEILAFSGQLKGIYDACNIYSSERIESREIAYTGMGRGRQDVSEELIDFVAESFRSVETGLANELKTLIDFLNDTYVTEEYNKVRFEEVQALARSCSTGCEIANFGKVYRVPEFKAFSSRLASCAIRL